MFWKKKTNPVCRSAKAPQDTIIYAIGDVHGNATLLQKMHKKILDDVDNIESARKVIVYLGDYIDRGLESKQVVEMLVENDMDGFEKVYLMGNHEDAMLKFLQEPQFGEVWFSWGGEATVRSYGVSMRDENGIKRSLNDIRDALQNSVSEKHMQFYKNLSLSHVEGDYIFVHAGLRPGVKLDNQTKEDLTTIRDEFIYSRKEFEKTVVFGHTIFADPYYKNGKIGVDTGAYASGKLTTVVLQDDSVRFLDVTKDGMQESIDL